MASGCYLGFRMDAQAFKEMAKRLRHLWIIQVHSSPSDPSAGIAVALHLIMQYSCRVDDYRIGR
jgi:hypothetical protein